MLNSSNSKNKIKTIILAVVISLVSVFFCILIFIFQVKKSILNSESMAIDLYKVKLSQERQEEIRRDFDQKYPLDTSSFQALAKRIQIEKKLTLEIETKLKQAREGVENKK